MTEELYLPETVHLLRPLGKGAAAVSYRILKSCDEVRAQDSIGHIIQEYRRTLRVHCKPLLMCRLR